MQSIPADNSNISELDLISQDKESARVAAIKGILDLRVQIWTDRPVRNLSAYP